MGQRLGLEQENFSGEEQRSADASSYATTAVICPARPEWQGRETLPCDSMRKDILAAGKRICPGCLKAWASKMMEPAHEQGQPENRARRGKERALIAGQVIVIGGGQTAYSL